MMVDAPMVVAVRCRALNEREAELGRSRFPSRSDCFYTCTFASQADAAVLTVDPDSVFLTHRPIPEFSPAPVTNCLATAPLEVRKENLQRRAAFFENRHDRRFTFDFVFDEFSSNAEIYGRTVAPLVSAVRAGFNGTCFAYGMTGAGKTYTMSGDGRTKGLCSLAIADIFNGRSDDLNDDDDASGDLLTVHASYLEIYNERVRDLLAPVVASGNAVGTFDAAGSASSRSSSVATTPRTPTTPTANAGLLEIVEDPVKGVVVQGLTEVLVSSTAELELLMDQGAHLRTKASTASNVVSSRSHAVLQLTVRRRRIDGGRVGAEIGGARGSRATRAQFLSGKLSLIDLAGSERAAGEEAVPKSERGDRRREGANINKSLLALGNCITVLGNISKSNGGLANANTAAHHVPYRDSKLTRLLKESLGGNTRTVMIATISPSCLCYEETLSTLKYALRARSISKKVHRNTVHVEEEIRGEKCYGEVLASLHDEVRSLRTLLSVTHATNEKLGLVPRAGGTSRAESAIASTVSVVTSTAPSVGASHVETCESHPAASEDTDWELLRQLQTRLLCVTAAMTQPPTDSVSDVQKPLATTPVHARQGRAAPPIGGMLSPAPDDRMCDAVVDSAPQGVSRRTFGYATRDLNIPATVTTTKPKATWKDAENSYYVPCDESLDCGTEASSAASSTGGGASQWTFENLLEFGATPAGRAALQLQQQDEARRRESGGSLGFLDLLCTKRGDGTNDVLAIESEEAKRRRQNRAVAERVQREIQQRYADLQHFDHQFNQITH